ncbi:TrkA family potassium uptake protein [Halorubrum ezzemoulense]|jgi:trk system potassium uptake protein TrkA|uniref:TrkA family potassium uptake protein n=1 Tax=Halorubrum ezzemoulense TaxID=337243 RepID=A0A256K6W3_HALEZ|nr:MULTISPECIES: TrkA family potassium uptake protein [Halorubrum]MDB2224900.1 TrkA family potassium uptake protein [Halorubrum ezzemoulense]MDB2259973.1 TrkA family potassium uptake protein [Halorubrum ezzemoulense]MDB2266793.1 TrkA family potassium uptake protein [Halorubrum ezzemoulense]MDB2273169.1 TrkA family potassium uptake protein [Halorubrum ezzemoulense]MDB9300857.1 TrkA family potassium uptake protein [Halorubrum ezzemoulense]
MTQSKRFVIAGGGRVGLQTAENLTEQGHEVLLIEVDADRVEKLSDAYLGPVIHGDATEQSILRQADLRNADAIAALTDETETNTDICMTAHHLAPAIRTLARSESRTEQEHGEVVDATLLPQSLGGDHAADMLTGEEIRTLVFPTADLDIIEVTVSESAPVAGRRLDEIALPAGSLLISTSDRESLAGPDTLLEPSEQYILAVESDVVDEVVKLFRG